MDCNENKLRKRTKINTEIIIIFEPTYSISLRDTHFPILIEV